MQAAALRYFLEVARTGSIAEASARLNIASSAISRQIAKLEAEVGTALFERRARGMVPSAAGELLAQHARRAVLNEDQVLSEIQRLRGLERGVVRIACTEGFAIDLMPEAIGTFRERHPGIQFDMRVLAPALVTQMVREGEVDIGLTFAFVPDASVRVELRGAAPILALMSPTHPLAGRPGVGMADIARYPVALPEKDTTARQAFDYACAMEGVTIEPALVTNYMSALWRFAEIRGSITVTGRVTVISRIWRFRLVAVPIAGEGIRPRRYEIQTMLGRPLPDAVRVFLDHLKGYISHLEVRREREGQDGQEGQDPMASLLPPASEI